EYDALSDVTHDRHKEVLQAFQDKGYCLPGKLRKIQHPDYPMLEYHLKNSIAQLTMQITQSCNLFCSYCSYSGLYNNRTHANKHMSYETMCKCVDFVMMHSRDLERITLGFYGGEPLLALDNIMECVEYVRENYPERNVFYTLTTNGTQFTDECATFLQDNNFSVLISLDGPAFIHDQHRKFADGTGSFDTVMKAVEYLKEYFPALYKKISFNTVVSPGKDYKCIKDFFDAETVFKDSTTRTAMVNTLGTNEEISYDDAFFITYRREMMKLLLYSLGFLSLKSVSKMFYSEWIGLEHQRKQFDTYMEMPEVAHHGGPCLPGARRLFVDVNGNFYPCERVSETSSATQIGHIDTGFDIDKARKVLNIGELTVDECLGCWNLIYCGICAAHADNETGLDKDTKLRSCAAMRATTLITMKTLCLLKEMGVNMEEVKLYEEVGSVPV
ncbi:MAG: Cys-rich peptide radical SAM maturase CcpM, partial [Firmicutes bacterium]|nr:Cys-rich peptide radical SAM maturase CcpM [Bacillota bacterium]